jgi:hypothetical protein
MRPIRNRRDPDERPADFGLFKRLEEDISAPPHCAPQCNMD